MPFKINELLTCSKKDVLPSVVTGGESLTNVEKKSLKDSPCTGTVETLLLFSMKKHIIKRLHYLMLHHKCLGDILAIIT